MKTRYYLCTLLLLLKFMSSAHAQDSTYTLKPQRAFSVGHGYYNYLLAWYDKTYPYFSKTDIKSSPTFLKIEFFNSARYSISLVTTYAAAYKNYNLPEISNVDANLNPVYSTYYYKYKWQRIALGARWNYYFFNNTHWSFYLGAGIGIAADWMTYRTDDPIQSNHIYTGLPFYHTLSVGAIYSFKKKWGVYAEGGFDDGALAQAGLFFKFKK